MLIKAIEETRDILLVFGGEVTYAIRTTAHGHPVRPQRPSHHDSRTRALHTRNSLETPSDLVSDAQWLCLCRRVQHGMYHDQRLPISLSIASPVVAVRGHQEDVRLWCETEQGIVCSTVK